MREGGGEPGKLPKQPKKKKKALFRKRRLLPEGHPQKFFKKTKRLIVPMKKTLRFRVLNVRR